MSAVSPIPGPEAACGIEIGGTWMRASLVETDTRKILDSQKVRTPSDPAQAVLRLQRLWQDAGSPERFGFASAAELQSGTVTRWPSQPAYVGRNLLAAFPGAQPVCLDDASAAAFGEHNRSSQADGGSSIFVSVGTGVGGGLVLGGRLWGGHRGTAMDIGHVAVPSASLVRCACGSQGCVQAIASGRALQEGDAADRGSRLALAAEGLSELILQLTRILDCPLFILGGGVFDGEPSLVEAVTRRARSLGVTAEFARGVLGTFAGSIGVAEFASAGKQ